MTMWTAAVPDSVTLLLSLGDNLQKMYPADVKLAYSLNQKDLQWLWSSFIHVYVDFKY